jgi:glycerol-3-phosphate acyltransferase PlsX
MPNKVRIALDAMGGDHGPSVVIPGAELSLARHPEAELLLFGDAAQIEPLLDKHPRVKAASRLVHTSVAIRMDDKPSKALRYGRRDSSMWLAVDAVKKREADVAVSAGNTGALMVMSKLHLRMMAGVDRPAIACQWPTLRGDSIVLDVGASIGAEAEHLVHLAAMGSAMARVLLNIEKPTVGLLNIGVEEVKGLEPVREAGRILREQPWPHMQYYGFVEADDIGKGTVDVVVTEGFAGNIALKAAEGTARQIGEFLRAQITQSFRSKLGYLFARPAFRAVREKMDPAKSNGGVLLGLNGIVIKSHGGASAEGFAVAIDIGYDMVRQDLLAKIGEALGHEPERATSARLVEGTAS